METNIKIELTGFCKGCEAADIKVQWYPEETWYNLDGTIAGQRSLIAYCRNEAICRMWAEKAVKE